MACGGKPSRNLPQQTSNFVSRGEALELIAQLRFYYMYHLTSKEHLCQTKIMGGGNGETFFEGYNLEVVTFVT